MDAHRLDSECSMQGQGRHRELRSHSLGLPRGVDRAARAALRRLLPALFLVLLPQVALAQFTIQRVSSPIFYTDAGNTPSLTCSYAAYRITNTSGVTYPDVWAGIGSFAGGIVHLAPTDDGVLHLGAMAPGQSRVAYFYLQASGTTAAAQTHTVSVYAAPPPGAALASQSFTITSVVSTIASNANKVTTVITGPTPPELGGIVTMTVSGQTGTLGSTQAMVLTAASEASWPAETFELFSVVMTLSGSPNAGVVTDSLIYVAPDPSNTTYQIVYRFRARVTTVGTTLVTPISYISSGNVVKHTDTGNFGGFAEIQPPSNQTSLSKLVNPTAMLGAGSVTYTLRVANQGTIVSSLDNLIDVLPAGASYVPGSAEFNGAAIADPSISGQTLSWVGFYSVPPGGTSDLTYAASYPNVGGRFVNSAIGHVGPTVIDSTVAPGDSLPAHAALQLTQRVSDVSIVKSASPDPAGLSVPLTFRLVVANAGPDTAVAVAVVDTLPAGPTFQSVTSTTGLASQSGGIVTADLGPLAPGRADTITIEMMPTALGSVTNTARVSSGSADPNLANNASTVTVSVVAPPDLRLAKRSIGPFQVGANGTYRLVATNMGLGPTTGAIAIGDTLPPGLSYVAYSGAGWTAGASGGIVTATHPGPIASGDSLVLTLTVHIDPAAFPQVINAATASTSADADAANDVGRDTTSVAGAPDLALSKRHAGSFTVGQTGTYTLVVTNVGTAAMAPAITVVDTLPTGLSFAAGAGSGWTIGAAGPVVTATHPGPLATNDSLVFTIDVNVAPAAIPLAVNAAAITAPGDFDPANDHVTDPTVVQGVVDLRIAKRHAGSFTVGVTGTYTLVVANDGSAATSGAITVRDTLPAGLSFVSGAGAGWSVSAAGGIVTATHPGPITPGDSLSWNLNVVPDPSAVPSVTNSARVVTPGDVNGLNDVASDPTAVLGVPDLAATKRGAGPFTIGTNGTYTVMVKNVGSAATAGTITVSDVLPAGLSFVSGSGPGWSVNAAGSTVTGTLPGPLAIGDSSSFVLTVAVDAAAAPQVINDAVASTGGDADAANDTGRDTTTVLAPADLALAKRHVGTFPPGASGTYTLVVTNLGDLPATGTITVADSLPPGLSFVALAGSGWSGGAAGAVVTASHAGPLAGHDSLSFDVDVAVAANAPTLVVNVAALTAPGDGNAANDRAVDPTAVATTPDLALAKRHAGSFTVGQNGVYTLVVRNLGSGATTGPIAVTDSLPAGLAFVSGSGAGWSFATAGSAVTASYAGAVAPGDSATCDLTVSVTAAAVPAVTNRAIAATAGDLDPANDSASDATVVNGVPDLALAKRHAGSFGVAQNGTYTLAVVNVGSAATSGVTAVTDSLPAGLAFVSGSGAGWSFAAAGSAVTATHAGAIAAGDSATFSLTVAASAAAVPAVTNRAAVATAGDTDPANDAASDLTLVGGAPDLALAKRHAGSFTVGQNGAYTLSARNLGSAATVGAITVTDSLPAGLTFVGGAGAGWSFTATGGVVTATHAGAVAAGDSATCTITVAVAAAAVPAVTNRAQVSTAGDLDPTNDAASDVTIVNGVPDLAMSKRHAGSFTVGQSGVYTLAVRNLGSGPTRGTITVTDSLPAGLAFASGAGSGWSFSASGTAVTATYAAALAPGDSATCDLTVAVSAAAVPAVTNRAIASVAGDSDPSNDAASDFTTVGGVPDVALAKRHAGAFTVGQNGVYTLVVRNVGSAATTGAITVTDSLPAGLAFVGGAGSAWSFAANGAVVTAGYATALAAGDSAACTITVDVGPAAVPAVVNVAQASAAGDAGAANDRATDPTVVNGGPDLALAKRALGPLAVGQPASFAIVVTNVGGSPASGITVSDTLQAGLQYASSATPAWFTTAAGPIVTSTYPGTLMPGDSLVLTVQVMVDAAAYPSVSNAAVVRGTGDLNPANDRGVTGPLAVTASWPDLVVEKTASPTNVDVGGAIRYTVTLHNQGTVASPVVTVRDTLPLGIRFVSHSARRNGVAAPDPVGAPGPDLAFNVGTVPANGALTLTYVAQAGVTALRGDGRNRATAVNDALGLRSNTASAAVHVIPGVFATDGIIAGKVFLDASCDSCHVQGGEEPGIPGVRIYLENGRSVITDVEGKYHFEHVNPTLHVAKLDRTTLPAGATLATLDTRNAFDAGSRFVDLKNGELARADFVVASRSPGVLAEIQARRELGEVSAAILAGQPTQPSDLEPGATRALSGTPFRGPGDGEVYRGVASECDTENVHPNRPDRPGVPGIASDHAPACVAGLGIAGPRWSIPADGRTRVPITVRVPGSATTRVTLETDGGAWQVKDLDPGLEGVQTDVRSQATVMLVAPARAGLVHLRVTRVTDLARRADGSHVHGPEEASGTVAFVPAIRAWMVAGLLNGRLDLRSLSNDALVAGERRDRFEDELRDLSSASDDGKSELAGRGALFLVGPLDPQTQLTLRYDSEHAATRRRFEDIRPDEGYVAFGDASIQDFEAQSGERLFARLDRGRTYAQYGDFLTPGAGPTQVLGLYQRSLLGGNAHVETDRVAADGFASHERDRQVVDEIRGLGISGPYALSRRDGVLNSERVEIVTRDRNNPSVILSRRDMTRFADYTIEPLSGRLVFRQPVPSVDERLNPVSVRVLYEVEGGGDRFWTYGADARVTPLERLEVAGSYVRDEDPLDGHRLGSAGARLRLLPRTFVTGEWARSDSTDGGAGDAWRAELTSVADRFDLRGFAVRTDPGFGNPSAGLAPGRDELGGAGHVSLRDGTGLAVEAIRTHDRLTDGTRQGASFGLEQRLGSRLRLDAGYRWAHEGVRPAGGGTLVPTPNDTRAITSRLTGQLDRRTSAYAEFEQDVQSSDRRRLAGGADVRLTDHVRLYGRHEFITSFAGPYALDEDQRLQTSAIGLAADDRKDLQAFTEYRMRDAFAGRTAEAAMGLRDRWRVSPGVRVDASFERVQPIRGSGVADTRAATAGLEWFRNPRMRGTARLEVRDAGGDLQWLTSGGFAYKIRRDWTTLARTFWTVAPDRDERSARNQLGLAFRETDANRWNALFRFDHTLERGGDLVGTGAQHEAFVLSSHLNVHPHPRLTLTDEMAGKWTHDITPAVAMRGSAGLIGGRALWDLSRRLDVGLSARALLDGGADQRSTGLGAELGVVVMRNLRLAGGYNVFGFKDRDFTATGSRTDRGAYVDLGFKFDESLFGRRAAPPVEHGTGSGESVGHGPEEDARARAAAAAMRHGAEVPGVLAAPHARITDPAIAADLRTIDGWAARAMVLPESVSTFGREKMLAWLRFARAEYADGDRGADVDSAVANAAAIYRVLAPSEPVGPVEIRQAFEAALPSSGREIGQELDADAARLHRHAGFHCAEREVAQLEVALAWARHDEAHAGDCGASPHLDEAMRLARVAREKADACLPPPPAPAPTLVVREAPASEAPLPTPRQREIAREIAVIPSGIHFALARHDLSPRSVAVVQRISALLRKYPDVRVELEGHTDSRGSVAYNLRLSQRRAATVRATLVADGVDSSRISATFAGKSKLLTTEQSVVDLALNRRVDFKYYDAAGQPIAQDKQIGDITVETPRAKAAKAKGTRGVLRSTGKGNGANATRGKETSQIRTGAARPRRTAAARMPVWTLDPKAAPRTPRH